MPIYEGTSQIQSLMAMKDTLGGIIRDPQASQQRRRRDGARCQRVAHSIGVSRAYRAYHSQLSSTDYAYGCG